MHGSRCSVVSHLLSWITLCVPNLVHDGRSCEKHTTPLSYQQGPIHYLLPLFEYLHVCGIWSNFSFIFFKVGDVAIFCKKKKKKKGLISLEIDPFSHRIFQQREKIKKRLASSFSTAVRFYHSRMSQGLPLKALLGQCPNIPEIRLARRWVWATAPIFECNSWISLTRGFQENTLSQSFK